MVAIGTYNGVDPLVRPILQDKVTSQDIENAKLKLSEVLGERPMLHLRSDEQSKEISPTWGDVINNFVDKIDEKQKIAQNETLAVLNNKSENLHQSILATQEAGVAFTLLLEMRNKLVDGFKELMRMSI